VTIRNGACVVVRCALERKKVETDEWKIQQRYSNCYGGFYYLCITQPLLLGDPENFIPADPLVTPIHILPEL